MNKNGEPAYGGLPIFAYYKIIICLKTFNVADLTFRKTTMLHWKILIGVLCLTLSLYAQKPDNKLHVSFLDVGQGDSVFIRSPYGYNIVIDGGPNLNLTDSVESIMPAQEHSIDLLVLTHPHSDHLFGFMEMLERYKIKYVLLTGVDYKSSLYHYFKQQIADKGVKILLASDSHDIYFNDGLILDIIYPSAPSLNLEPDNVNDDSVMLRLVYADTKILLSGDAEIEEEKNVLLTSNDISTNVLKAGHHGSRTSSTVEYLEAAHPEYAVISAGVNNQYHHPHPETLQKYDARGITTFRTDLLGTIEMVFDERGLLNIPIKKSIL